MQVDVTMRVLVHGIVTHRPRRTTNVVADTAVRQPYACERARVRCRAKRGTGDEQLERRAGRIQAVSRAIEHARGEIVRGRRRFIRLLQLGARRHG
jgi:hypothetical protein